MRLSLLRRPGNMCLYGLGYSWSTWSANNSVEGQSCVFIETVMALAPLLHTQVGVMLFQLYATDVVVGSPDDGTYLLLVHRRTGTSIMYPRFSPEHAVLSGLKCKV